MQDVNALHAAAGEPPARDRARQHAAGELVAQAEYQLRKYRAVGRAELGPETAQRRVVDYLTDAIRLLERAIDIEVGDEDPPAEEEEEK